MLLGGKFGKIVCLVVVRQLCYENRLFATCYANYRVAAVRVGSGRVKVLAVQAVRVRRFRRFRWSRRFRRFVSGGSGGFLGCHNSSCKGPFDTLTSALDRTFREKAC